MAMELLTNLLLIGIFLILVGFCGALFALLLVIRSYIRRFQAFVNAPDDKTPSEFARLTDAVGHTLGHAAAIEIKTTIMGKLSGQSRASEAEAHEILEATQPQLAGLIDAIPKGARRGITKNPGLASFALDFLLQKFGNGLLSGGVSGGPPSNGHSAPMKSKL